MLIAVYGSMPAIGQVNLPVRFGSDAASFCYWLRQCRYDSVRQGHRHRHADTAGQMNGNIHALSTRQLC